MYNDYLSNPSAEKFATVPSHLGELDRATTVLNKEVEKTFTALSSAEFKAKVGPATLTSKKLGNMYTGSLYGALASLLDSVDSQTLQGKRVAMYSYGSGLAASFFSLRVKGDTTEMHTKLQLKQRLVANQVRPCEEFVQALQVRSLWSLHCLLFCEPVLTDLAIRLPSSPSPSCSHSLSSARTAPGRQAQHLRLHPGRPD